MIGLQAIILNTKLFQAYLCFMMLSQHISTLLPTTIQRRKKPTRLFADCKFIQQHVFTTSTREFRDAAEVSTILNPVILYYGTVFNMGDFYLSTLVFQGAFFIHLRRFQEDYMLFMESLRSFASTCCKKLLMVTDREFDFLTCFLCAWMCLLEHLERDIFYLKNLANWNQLLCKCLMIEESEVVFN